MYSIYTHSFVHDSQSLYTIFRVFRSLTYDSHRISTITYDQIRQRKVAVCQSLSYNNVVFICAVNTSIKMAIDFHRALNVRGYPTKCSSVPRSIILL